MTVQVDVVTYEDIATILAKPNVSDVHVQFDIGDAENLSRQARRRAVAALCKLLRRVGPTVPVQCSISGYGEDLRELWDIPAARRYWLAFFDDLQRLYGIGPDRFTEHEHAVYAACQVAEQGGEITVSDMSERQAAECRLAARDEYVKKARRKLN